MSPLYTYVCNYCGARQELLRVIGDRDEPVFCDQHQITTADFAIRLMRRTYESPATHFHGPGVTRGSSGFGKTSEAKETPSEHKGESSTT